MVSHLFPKKEKKKEKESTNTHILHQPISVVPFTFEIEKTSTNHAPFPSPQPPSLNA
jgi:hypothetical protein